MDVALDRLTQGGITRTYPQVRGASARWVLTDSRFLVRNEE